MEDGSQNKSKVKNKIMKYEEYQVKGSSSYTSPNHKSPSDAVNSFQLFVNKIQNFTFSPPSDNLWLIQITLADRNTNPTQAQDLDKKNLLQLYENITAVNTSWSNRTSNTTWEISVNEQSNKRRDYIKNLCESELQFFLAQSANFTPLSLNYDNQPFGEMQQHGSFYKNAKTVKSRKDDDSLKIGFLTSNWDIGDILIEPWMAAIAQYGLIERGNLCIKAKIIITEYSASRPKKDSEEKYGTRMEARKQYIFNNCFPVSRDEIKKTYDPNDAGTFKTQVVTFVYDTYKVEYLF